MENKHQLSFKSISERKHDHPDAEVTCDVVGCAFTLFIRYYKRFGLYICRSHDSWFRRYARETYPDTPRSNIKLYKGNSSGLSVRSIVLKKQYRPQPGRGHRPTNPSKRLNIYEVESAAPGGVLIIGDQLPMQLGDISDKDK